MKGRAAILIALVPLAGCQSPSGPKCTFSYTADIRQAAQAELRRHLGDNARFYNADNPVDAIAGENIQLVFFPLRNVDGAPDRIFVLVVDPCTRQVSMPRTAL